MDYIPKGPAEKKKHKNSRKEARRHKARSESPTTASTSAGPPNVPTTTPFVTRAKAASVQAETMTIVQRTNEGMTAISEMMAQQMVIQQQQFQMAQQQMQMQLEVSQRILQTLANIPQNATREMVTGNPHYNPSVTTTTTTNHPMSMDDEFSLEGDLPASLANPDV